MKTNARYITHRLVEVIQTDKGPRQRIIMHLGTISLPKSEWRKLAAVLESRLAGQLSLFEEQFPFVAEAADKAFEHYQFLPAKTFSTRLPMSCTPGKICWKIKNL